MKSFLQLLQNTHFNSRLELDLSFEFYVIEICSYQNLMIIKTRSLNCALSDFSIEMYTSMILDCSLCS